MMVNTVRQDQWIVRDTRIRGVFNSREDAIEFYSSGAVPTESVVEPMPSAIEWAPHVLAVMKTGLRSVHMIGIYGDPVAATAAAKQADGYISLMLVQWEPKGTIELDLDEYYGDFIRT